jgi:hypothetical protein
MASRVTLARVQERVWGEIGVELAPVLFVLVMLAGAGMLYWLSRSRIALGIYATALLFGIIHVRVWPTPIPLFLLGLGLGYIAYRTQSVVPAIVTHATFNGVMVVVLLVQPPTGAQNGSGVTDACVREPAISTSRIVPGSS